MKKQVALLLTAGILASSVVPASAAFKQGKVVSYFDSMLGYESASGDQTLPEGWEVLYNAGHTDEIARAKKVDSEFITGSDATSNVIKLNGFSANFGAAMRYTFDEVIKTGKVHAGFDMKVTGASQEVRFGGHYVQSGNYNPDDSLGMNYNSDGTPKSYWDEKNTYLNIKGDSEGTKAYTCKPANSDTKEDTGVTVTPDVWYRYDLYLDTQAKTYDIYIDGVLINSYTLDRYLLKSFWFQCDTGTAYVDNVCFEHYQTGDFDTMQAVIDYDSDGVALSGGIVNVSFSEKLSDEIEVSDAHFIVKNAEGEEQYVIDYVVPTDNGGAEIGLSDIAAGTYTIEVSDELKGAISGTSASNVMKFSTVTEDSTITGAAYYMNEDFEQYAGGFPTGWGKGDNFGFKYNYTTGDIGNYKMTAGEGRNGGKALQFDVASQERTIEYKFPNTIYDGKFTIEFDLYHDPSARWALGLLTPSEYREDLVESADSTKSGFDSLADRRNNSLILAQFEATDGEYKILSTNTGYSNWIGPAFEGVTVPGGAWTHIKAVIDGDGNKYTVTATDELGVEKTATVTGITRIAKRTLYNTTTQKTEDIFGIAGLRLLASKNTDGIVKFDNLKVYGNADKAYNLYEDFNTMVKHNDHATDGAGDTIMNSITSSGISGRWDYFNVDEYGSQGKALKVHTAGNQTRMIVKWLSIPVKAGRSFKVEFDIKNDASYSNNGYKGGAWELALGNWDAVKNSAYDGMNRIMSRPLVADGVAPKLTASGLNDTGVEEKMNTEIEFTDGAWNRIELFVDNAANKMIVTKKNPSTDEVLGSYEVTSLPWLRSTDISYIGFRAPWECGPSFSLDNLKVYETDTPEAVSVTSVKAVGYDGTNPDIAGTMSEASSAIEINLSHPIANVNAVSLVYPAIGTGTQGRTISCTKTLSNGGRTINVSFTEKPRLNEDIAIEIVQNAVFAKSYLTNFGTYNKVFKLIESTDGGLVVTDFRVYMYEEERVDGNGHVYPAAWVPYFGDAFTDLTANDRIRLQVKGYNTGAEQKLFLSGNDYITDAQGVKELADTTAKVLTIPSGTFEETLDIPNAVEATSFKGLLWQYPGMAPIDKALEYNR